MRNAVNNFQKSLFIILLYASTFSGFIADLALSGNRTALYFIFDGLIMFLAILSLSFLRGRLVWIVLFILACIGVNLSYSNNDLLYSFNGIREILIIVAIVIFYNKIFSEYDEELTGEYIDIFKKFAVVFLIAQLPVSLYQFITYGPSDYVGGTFGNKGSGILTLSVVSLVFFLSYFTRNLTQRVLLYVCLVPLLLNETKISFILIPMLILFIHFRPKIKNIIGAVAAAALFLFVFNQYYSNTGVVFENNIAGIFSKDFLNDYLFGDMYSSDDVPRFTKIVLGWQLIAEQTNTFLFGMEYGLFKGGAVVESTQFAQSIQWLLSGTRPYLFFILIQGGIFLVLGIFWLMFHINNYFTTNNNRFKIFLFMLFLIILFYNDALRNQGFVVIYFFTVYFANSSLYIRKFNNIS
jgi:hypothetical protein